MVIGWTECYDDSGVTRRHQSTLCIGVFFVKVHVWSTMWDPAAPANYYKKKKKKNMQYWGEYICQTEDWDLSFWGCDMYF